MKTGRMAIDAVRHITCLIVLSLITAFAQEPPKVAGRWDITIHFVHGTGNYTAFFEQEAERLSGTFRGQYLEGELEGTIQQEKLQFRGNLKIEGTRLFYDFTGTVQGDDMSGTVTMGEYGEARWTARKRR
jgi:hypothetical protein